MNFKAPRSATGLVSKRICCRQFCAAGKKNLVPNPSWSLKDLQLSAEMTKVVVSESDIQHLCKLSCIELNQSKTSSDTIVEDVNVILRCADSIKSDGTKGEGCDVRNYTQKTLDMKALREDVADETSIKEMLLSKAPIRKNDYYSVPNVKSKN